METNQVTPFDQITQTREIQMLKTMIPYLQNTQKKQFALLVKYMELQHTMRLFAKEDQALLACSVESNASSPIAMLTELRSFFNEKEQDTIDMMINLLYMKELSYEL
jgi:hypothetical protein